MHDHNPCNLFDRHLMAAEALSLPLLSLSFSSLSFSLSPFSLSFSLSLSLFLLVSQASEQDTCSTTGHVGRAQGQRVHGLTLFLSLSPPSLSFSLFLSLSLSPHMLYPFLSPRMLSLSLSTMLSPFLSLSLHWMLGLSPHSLSLSPLQRRERSSIRHLVSLSLLQREERLRRSISLPLRTASEEGGGREGGVIPVDTDGNNNGGGNASGNSGGNGDNRDRGRRC